MKKTTIIYAHPYDQSYNQAILTQVAATLRERKQDYDVIDLYKDHFNPVYTEEELQYFHQGKALDPLILNYQKQLQNCSELIFIFPIWWYDTPGILKGFIDKVLLNHFAYIDTKTGVAGKLTNITKATVITTSKAPTWYLKWFGGNAINKVLIKSTLKGIGIKNAKWINMDKINSSTLEQRQAFLTQLPKAIN
ncbi:NAD(P)H dehydrogenase (quinone) [Enterococcus sp. PF1-24]|uniref:NAD(P)H-dependent oxidoreductase n=1 Tax=unclassified Enterococcus TaxID=2608891 RepID=UPI002473D7C5|nr:MULTISPECIES: NAD(P)H-dependent oxidoreductase [unclassified Enterococcus]MDH6365850.1 NAD(P)H dehydrogenase (quinone) [Enterococcus sp. PFB1-1]MDH6402942.1 NAD(P)H dehydrogenase (quinone) [Enterococcus sp. PF1-24]